MERLSDQALQTFIDLRRDIHRHPELAFNERRTAALVAAQLGAWGYEVTTGLGGTGVVGQLRRGKSTRSIGLRADMDALPIAEATGAAWASCEHGVMHACGHDGHTAMLLAAAQHLAQHGRFDGTLNLVFQPAEEGGGGALKMMEDGLFERFPCDAIFAMHNMPGFAQGQLLFRSGPTMASSDYATVTLHGVGGHGALPHKACDPLVAAASLVMALQTIVSRNVDPMQPSVVTVGAFHAGEANNVIPSSARLEISLRALDPQVRRDMERRIKELVALQAQSFGVRAEIDWRPGYAVLVNDAQQTARALAVAQKHFPMEQVAQAPMLTGSEDFAFMLERVPGCYLFIGNGADGEPGACMVHNPAYDFNDQNIAPGAAYWIALVNELLSPTHPRNPTRGDNPMNARIRIQALVAAATFAATGGITTAFAQAFPTKPLNMVVPYPAGGPSDHIARQVQPLASQTLGQNIIVENVGGASGTIGVTRALSAPADGHSLILGSPMELMLSPLALQGVRYKTEDMKLVAHLVSTSTILAVRSNLGVNSVSELIALAKKSTERPLSYGSVGTGSLYHLIGEKFSQDARVPLTHVPYRGIAPVMTDLMGGQIDMAFLPMAGTIMQAVNEGKIRGLGVTARQPHPLFSQYPALATMPGLESMQFEVWAGVQVHRNTPDAVVERLNQAFYTALQNPDVRKSLEATGNNVMNPRKPAELAVLYKQETERYRAIARSINLQAQAAQ